MAVIGGASFVWGAVLGAIGDHRVESVAAGLAAADRRPGRQLRDDRVRRADDRDPAARADGLWPALTRRLCREASAPARFDAMHRLLVAAAADRARTRLLLDVQASHASSSAGWSRSIE